MQQELFRDSSTPEHWGKLGVSWVRECSLGLLAVKWVCMMVCIFLLEISFQKDVLHFGHFYAIYISLPPGDQFNDDF